MKILIMKRQHGKTHKLIEKSLSEGGIIVCENKFMAREIKRRAKELSEKKLPEPITFSQFIKGDYYCSTGTELYIDNIDILINEISNVPITIATCSIGYDEIMEDF